MKRLFETANLEAELFDEDLDLEKREEGAEIDLENLTEESMLALENIADKEMDEFPVLELTLELADGRSLEYEVAAIFAHKEKEYVGLHPKSDAEGLIHIMRFSQGENDELVLHQIKDEEEIQEVYQVFFDLFAEDTSFEDISSEEDFEEEDFEEDFDEDERALEDEFPEDGSELNNDYNNENE